MSIKLVVGLGNPGRRYQETRHNVGFEVLGQLARQYGTSVPRGRFQGEVVEGQVEQQRFLLLTPHTYMNRSGSSVLAARDFYKVEDSNLLLVCDDFNLPLAKLRFRASGSAGGQKGLEDVIRLLGTNQFPRLRIGIGTPPPQWDVADYVLSKFRSDERPEIDHAIQRAAQAVADWVRLGVEHCMNHYNANERP